MRLESDCSLLKKSLVELYEEEKHRKPLSDETDSQQFGSKDNVSHFLELISLVFQQAGLFDETAKCRKASGSSI
jgi:hypothetical protein